MSESNHQPLVPEVLDGWAVLHHIFRIDWPRWNALTGGDRANMTTEAANFLDRAQHVDEGESALFSLLGHKGDLLFLNFRKTLDELNEVELEEFDLENALAKQYAALVAAEGVTLEFSEDGIREIARVASEANDRMENIGARRLHTVMATLMEDLLFELPEGSHKTVLYAAKVVRERLSAVIDDDDLRRYIL